MKIKRFSTSGRIFETLFGAIQWSCMNYGTEIEFEGKVAYYWEKGNPQGYLSHSEKTLLVESRTREWAKTSLGEIYARPSTAIFRGDLVTGIHIEGTAKKGIVVRLASLKGDFDFEELEKRFRRLKNERS